jgi:hypothetical protein
MKKHAHYTGLQITQGNVALKCREPPRQYSALSLSYVEDAFSRDDVKWDLCIPIRSSVDFYHAAISIRTRFLWHWGCLGSEGLKELLLFQCEGDSSGIEHA